MSSVNETIISYCEENAKQENPLGSRRLTGLILEQHPEFGKPSKVRAVIIRWQRKQKKGETLLEVEADEELVYQVEGDDYLLMGGKLRFSIEFIDQLFYEFSEHGLNKQSTQIILDYNLQPTQWVAIKRAFNLYKKSNIFSPYTWDSTPASERQAMIDEKMRGLFENTGALVYKQYNDAVIRESRKIIEQSNKHKALEAEFKSILAEYFVKHETVQVPRAFKAKGDIEHLVVKIADPHFGAQTNDANGTVLTLHYSPEILLNMFDMAAAEINELGAKKVTIAFLGDLIESFTGLNHPNSFKGMARNSQGAQSIIGAHKMIVEFLQKVNNVVDVVLVGGNHDRGTSSNKEDDQAWIAETVAHFLAETYRGIIPVQYHSFIVSKEINGIHYIFTHGDSRAVNKKDVRNNRGKKSNSDSKFEFIYRYGNNKMFNLICTGHLHSRGIQADQVSHRHIICPSMFTGNLYAERLGYTSLPGITVSYNNGRGYPKVYDIPLI